MMPNSSKAISFAAAKFETSMETALIVSVIRIQTVSHPIVEHEVGEWEEVDPPRLWDGNQSILPWWMKWKM